MLFDSITSGRLLIVCELYAQPLDRGPYITGTVIGRPSTGEGVPLVGTARPAKNAGLLNNENRNEIKRQIVIIDSLTHPQGVHSEINGRPMTVPTVGVPIAAKTSR